MLYITKKELGSKEYSNFSEITSPLQKLNKSDIATILDIFDTMATKNNSIIEGIAKDSEGHFLFIVDENTNECKFDLYDFLNSHITDAKEKINCANAKLLYPKTLSNGEYFYSSQAETSTSNLEEDATGYLDEAELKNLQGLKTYKLEYAKSGADILISERQLSIGRSSRESDFVIQNNTNVSRRHCLVYLKNGIPMIKDNKSLNGTFIGNYRLEAEEEKELHEGDTVYIADEKFIVR